MPARKLEWKKIKRDDDGGAPLLITPLIDIMFLLLIFFVMNTSFSKLTPLDINLPESSAAAGQVRETLTVTLRPEGVIELNGDTMGIDALSLYLEESLGNTLPDNVNIAGDEKVSYAFLVQVMDILSVSGLNDITLLTENG